MSKKVKKYVASGNGLFVDTLCEKTKKTLRVIAKNAQPSGFSLSYIYIDSPLPSYPAYSYQSLDELLVDMKEEAPIDRWKTVTL